MTEIPNNHGQVLAQEPVKFTVDVKRKWWQRYFPKLYPLKKEYTVSPLKNGNLVRISDILLSIKGTDESENRLNFAHQLIKAHTRDICRIVAIAIANSKEGPSESLIDELYWNLEPTENLQLALIVLQQMNIQGFILTIDLIKGISVFPKEN